MRIEMLAAVPFAWPAACVALACACAATGQSCGVYGCVGIAAFAAAALFLLLSAVGELSSLGAIRD